MDCFCVFVQGVSTPTLLLFMGQMYLIWGRGNIGSSEVAVGGGCGEIVNISMKEM